MQLLTNPLRPRDIRHTGDNTGTDDNADTGDIGDPRDAAVERAGGNPATTLADLCPGASGRILGVERDADPATARRLGVLGFAPGAAVTVLRRAPLADPVIFRIAGYEIALRRAQARHIRVQPAG